MSRPLASRIRLGFLALLLTATALPRTAEAVINVRNFDEVDRKITVISVGNIQREIIVPARRNVRIFEPYVQFVDETGNKLQGYDPFEFVIQNGTMHINRYNDRGHD